MITRAIAISTLLILSLTSTGYCQKKQLNEPVLIHADDLSFDKEKNTVTASGNVEVYQEKEVLTADTITYNRLLDKITATGHVVWQRETGDVFFGSVVELEDRMKDGVIKEFRGLLIDESRLAANVGTRKNGNETQMNQAVYSPCKLCKNDPTQAPLWQIKSETALWDETNHDIIYTDAWMEVLGVPVLYTPYMRHPDPSVKQRSGILTPIISTSKDLGFYVGLPYYYVISPDKDITVTPLITSNMGQFLSGEYRQLFSNARLNLGGSYGSSKRKVNGRNKDAWRGHVDSDVEWDINDYWRFEANALRATDKTYLRNFPFYGYVHENVLTSKAKVEGFYGLNYFRTQGFLYQGLRDTDKQKTIPIVAPAVDLNYLSPQQFWNSRFTVDANGLVITRKEGTNVQRLSSTVGWNVPFVSVLGDKHKISLLMRGDGYNRENFTRNNDGTKARAFPQAYWEWEYPWIQTHNTGSTVISPMASLVVAPKIGNQNNIPNEDCDYIDPNDDYVLSNDRFPGLDRIDDGSRINYGLKAYTQISKDLKGGAFFGQTASFTAPNRAFAGTGFEKKYSDIFGRVNVTLFEYLDARYRFRLDHSNFSAIRNELQTSIGVPEFKVNVDYLKLPRFVGDTQRQGDEQISLGISSVFAKGWLASVSTVRDLGKSSRTLENVGNISYENECINVALQLSQTFYKSRNGVSPDHGFMFILTFKTMGGQTLHKIKWNKEFKAIHGNDTNN